MRSVLCFGDSNTYGQIPGSPTERYGPNVRWTGILRNELGPDWLVIEEGHSGRTTVNDDPIEGAHKNGRTYLRPCVETHKPLDLIILMLGTNDLKARFHKPSSEIAMGIGCLVHDIKDVGCGPGHSIPEIMIVSPPPLLDEMNEWNSIFADAPEKSRELSLQYETMADSLEVHFFDAGSVVICNEADGFHIDDEGHKLLGTALAQEIEAIGWTNDDG